MPHIPGHERGAMGAGLVNRAAEDAVRVLPNQQPLGNANLPNVAAAQDAAAGLPPIVPDAPPGGPRHVRFPWLEKLIGIGDLRIGEVPMAELNLNLAERYGPGGSRERREEGLGVLQDALNNIGSSEGEIAAREVALQRLRGGGLGAGALRGQLAASQEAALRQQAEQFAQRGLGGGVPGVAMMRAQQGGAIQAAGTEAAFRENLQRSALQDINAMNQEIGNRRLAATDLLQNYLGSWEFPPNEFSGLGIKPEDANTPAGGNLAYQGPRMGGEAGPDTPVQDFGDPNAWELDDSGWGRVVPDGHEFAGCSWQAANIGGPAQFACPAGHPRHGRHNA